MPSKPSLSYLLRDIPPKLWASAKRRAAKERRPLRWIILDLLTRYAEHGAGDIAEPPKP